MNTVDFAGIKVDNLTIAEALARVAEFLTSRTPHLMVTANPELIVAAQKDFDLKKIINSADLRVPDGISMVVVSKILRNPLKERVTGIDLMLKIIERSAKFGYRIFLLGGQPGVAERASENLKVKYPKVQICGTDHGYFGIDTPVIQKIKDAHPDILFAGLGGVKQEKWLAKYLADLNVPVCLGVGGSLDVIAGRVKRAPRWLQKLYIEWLYRLITQPWRWKRQRALSKFLRLMFFPRR